MIINGREIPDCTIEDKWDLEENYEDYYYDDEENDDNLSKHQQENLRIYSWR